MKPSIFAPDPSDSRPGLSTTRPRRSSFPALRGLAVLTGLLSLAPGVAAAGEENRSIPDVVEQFRALKHHGEGLGFRLPSELSMTLAGACHWQGIQRHDSSGVPYLYLSHANVNGPAPGDSDGPASLVVVRMASRGPDGERLRSNRLLHIFQTEETPPTEGDQAIQRHFMPEYDHAGGLQLVGGVLAVPLEGPRDPDCEDLEDPDCGSPESKILFFDVAADPELSDASQHPLHELDLDVQAGIVALTDLPDGRYLLAVTGGAGAVLYFYRSSGPDWRAPGFQFTLAGTWSHLQLQPPDAIWPYSIDTGGAKQVSSHQTLNFVKQDDGRLFLLGAHNTRNLAPSVMGSDVAVLYEIGGFDNPGPQLFITITEVLGLRFFNDTPGAETDINFNAGGGVYLSPTQELLLYGVEHYNEGPGDSVEIAEYRHRGVFRPGSPNTLPTARIDGPAVVKEGEQIHLSGESSGVAALPWAELYLDDFGWQEAYARLESQDLDPTGQIGQVTWTFSGNPDPEQSVMVDLLDIHQDDYGNFELLDGGFSNVASSMQWWAPPGCNVEVGAETSFTRILSLAPTPPAVSSIPNLAAYLMCPLTGACVVAGDQATALRFTGDCSGQGGSHRWSTNAPAAMGSLIAPTNGPLVTFQALDDPGDGGAAEADIHLVFAQGTAEDGEKLRIRVTNVPPELDGVTLSGPIDEGGKSDLDVTFSDPGSLDTHSLSIDWGDGITTALSAPLGSRSFAASHRYLDNPPGAADGEFGVELLLTDKDGGRHTRNAQVRVRNRPPQPRVQPHHGGLEGTPIQFLGSVTDPGPADTFEAVWAFGDGASASGSLTPVHAYQDDGAYTLSLTATDDDGGFGQDQTLVPVSNVAPKVTARVNSARLDCLDAVLQLKAVFKDPGRLDTHSARIAWGDGTEEDVKVLQGAGAGQLGATHRYPGFGHYTIVVTVQDDDGGEGRDTLEIVVVDAVPPLVETQDARRLWPPDHEYVLFRLSDCASARDACDAQLSLDENAAITSVTSDELEDAPGAGDGQTLRDILIVSPQSVKLRAERDLRRDGRVYTVHFVVADAAGNAASASCKVSVPRLQQGEAIDSGAQYTVFP